MQTGPIRRPFDLEQDVSVKLPTPVSKPASNGRSLSRIAVLRAWTSRRGHCHCSKRLVLTVRFSPMSMPTRMIAMLRRDCVSIVKVALMVLSLLGAVRGLIWPKYWPLWSVRPVRFGILRMSAIGGPVPIRMAFIRSLRCRQPQVRGQRLAAPALSLTLKSMKKRSFSIRKCCLQL